MNYIIYVTYTIYVSIYNPLQKLIGWLIIWFMLAKYYNGLLALGNHNWQKEINKQDVLKSWFIADHGQSCLRKNYCYQQNNQCT